MEKKPESRPTVAAVILTRNEKENIVDCLKTVNWCDEIIVIDDKSSDATPEIAEKFGAQVFFRDCAGDFAAQRNFAFKKAKSEWVLFIDADERVSEKLKAEILKLLKRAQIVGFSGYKMKRQDIFAGRKLRHGETAHVKLLRLGRKNAGIWKRPVHEVWKIDGKVGRLRYKLIHYPHPTISGFLSEINYYTEIEARYRKSSAMGSNIIQLSLYPLAKFVKNYIALLGFLDGFEGFVMAFMMSLHSLCVRVKMMQA